MMKQTISSPLRKFKLLLVLPLIAGVFYAFAAPEYKFIGGAENQSPQKSLYTITKDKIDIPFTTQFQKSDLETVKTELAKLGMKIEYTSLDFTNDGSLKQISTSITRSDGGNVSFYSGELTSTNYPTFRTYPDGSFGVYSQKAVTGKVIAEDGKPLKGSSVIVSGTTTGTVTDANGNFKLIMTDNSPISISYVGFSSVKVNPDFEKEMVITMKRNIISIEFGNMMSETSKNEQINLNESNALVIVDGKEITQAESLKINPDRIESIDVLKGESAKATYGEKGKDGVILVTLKNDDQAPQTLKVQTNSPLLFRNTDGSGNQPLYLKDGIDIDSKDIQNIDPETIESINVLKGESAMTKYGDKGKNGVVEITLKPKNPYTIVEEMPSFPGGTEALNAFINANLNYPTIALENRIRGRVFVSFVVGKNGEINKSVKVTRGVDPALDKEAMRIVKSMPNWNPGKQNGENVEVAYEIPIDFKIPADYHPISPEKLRTNASSRIGNISWVNNTIYSTAKLNEVLGIKKGEKYSKEKLTERIQSEVAGLYLDNGYLFYNAQITETQQSDDVVDLTFTIYEGNRGKIGKIEISGNKSVSTKDILNIISLKSGDWFSRTKLIQSVRALATIDKLDPEKINPAVNPQLGNVYNEFSIVDLVFNVTEK